MLFFIIGFVETHMNGKFTPGRLKMARSKSPYIGGRSGIFMGNSPNLFCTFKLFQKLVTFPGLRPATLAATVGTGYDLQISEIFFECPN